MALYEHICTNIECVHEWEEEYSIKADPPEFCPKCGQKTAKRLISLGGKGQVQLTGQEYADKISADTQQLKKEIYASEKVYSNFLGEDKYQKLQTQMDKRRH